MTPPRFLAPPDALARDPVRLVGAEAHHAAVVRRLRPGEDVEVTDGAGQVVRGVVREARPDALVVDVRARRQVPPPQPRVVVAQALPKGERATLAVAALTEVGVDEVVPWAAARCVPRWTGPRGERSRERWAAVAREAGKQARRDRTAEVAALATKAELARRAAAAAACLVLEGAAELPLADVQVPATGEVLLVVGPEGGITDDELATLAAAGGRAVRLGPTVLRTSTAGAVAAALVLSRTARWRPAG